MGRHTKNICNVDGLNQHVFALPLLNASLSIMEIYFVLYAYFDPVQSKVLIF